MNLHSLPGTYITSAYIWGTLFQHGRHIRLGPRDEYINHAYLIRRREPIHPLGDPTDRYSPRRYWQPWSDRLVGPPTRWVTACGDIIPTRADTAVLSLSYREGRDCEACGDLGAASYHAINSQDPWNDISTFARGYTADPVTGL